MCAAWLPANEVHAGLCRPHANQQDRARYARDAAYRGERRQHARSRKRGVGPIPPDAQAHILVAFGGRCAYCPAPATTWDHIVPISAGGRTTPGNVAPACATCNSSKNDRELWSWLEATGRTPHQALAERLDLARLA